jgi:hypothetical protein
MAVLVTIIAKLRTQRALIGALILCTVFAIIALSFGGVHGGAPAKSALPRDTAHLGVASCAGSTCHGRSQPDGVVVRQDEIMRWQEPSSPTGAHSRAYAVLSGPLGDQIAHRLGLGSAASAPMCLGCHADPSPNHGARFQMSDAIGCEACHGGAENWIDSHKAVGATHNGNIARGMVDLTNPTVKAAVCLDCHYGSADGGQFVTHKIMAAGHPRLSYELDLFSTLQTHHNEDTDYAARKGRTNNVRVWAVGQAMAIERQLSLFANPGIGTEGAFPEFYFFDCHSCHRQIRDDQRFSPTVLDNPGRPLPPGTPPFNDENMIMLSAAARVAAPALGQRFDADARAFHAAIAKDRGSALAAAGRLRASAGALGNAFAAASFSREQVFAIIDSIAGEAISPRYTDFTGSTQSVMAIDTLLSALVNSGQISPAAAGGIRIDINRAYAAVREPNAYRSGEFRRALGSAARTIRTLK